MRRIDGAMSPDISVVVCTWNRASLLGEALDALLGQQDSPRYEIVIVDNASTDRTRTVVEQRVASDSRIRYVHEGRQGLSYARNTGIAVTSGLSPAPVCGGWWRSSWGRGVAAGSGAPRGR